MGRIRFLEILRLVYRGSLYKDGDFWFFLKIWTILRCLGLYGRRIGLRGSFFGVGVLFIFLVFIWRGLFFRVFSLVLSVSGVGIFYRTNFSWDFFSRIVIRSSGGEFLFFIFDYFLKNISDNNMVVVISF